MNTITIKKVVNCTPHEVVIFDNDEDRNVLAVIKPSGFVPRVAQKTTREDQLFLEEFGITVPGSENQYGELEDMPPFEEDTLYIVSAMAIGAMPRNVLVRMPNEQVRDDGKVVGCLSLAPRQK